MKKMFIETVCNQPFKIKDFKTRERDPALGTEMRIHTYRVESLGFGIEVSEETSYPIIPVMDATIEKTDDVEILLLMRVPSERIDDATVDVRPHVKYNLDKLKEELKQLFEKKEMVAAPKIRLVEIPEDESNTNMLLVFNELRKLIPNNVSLSCDVTYGNKSLVILLFNLIRYCNQRRNEFYVDRLVYGDSDWTREDGAATIYDQSFEFTIDEVITASLFQDDDSLDNALYKMTENKTLPLREIILS